MAPGHPHTLHDEPAGPQVCGNLSTAPDSLHTIAVGVQIKPSQLSGPQRPRETGIDGERVRGILASPERGPTAGPSWAWRRSVHGLAAKVSGWISPSARPLRRQGVAPPAGSWKGE